jgi:hypothetical protein
MMGAAVLNAVAAVGRATEDALCDAADTVDEVAVDDTAF